MHRRAVAAPVAKAGLSGELDAADQGAQSMTDIASTAIVPRQRRRRPQGRSALPLRLPAILFLVLFLIYPTATGVCR